MIFLKTVSDDSEDRDVERKRSPYISRRELWIASALVAAAFLIFRFTIYRTLVDDRDWVVSQQNLRGIGKALLLYAEASDSGLPAAYAAGEGGRPITENGRPLTWAHQIYASLPAESSLKSPKSRDEWDTILKVRDERNQAKTVNLSYGIVAGFSNPPERLYNVKEDAFLVAETIGGGQANTLDPLPLGDRDGFLVGYDDSNSAPTPKTEVATRLAFSADSADAEIHERNPIHPGRGVLVLRKGGGLKVIQAGDMRVLKRGKLPAGPWVPN